MWPLPHSRPVGAVSDELVVGGDEDAELLDTEVVAADVAGLEDALGAGLLPEQPAASIATATSVVIINR